jgi:hypothetical protein
MAVAGYLWGVYPHSMADPLVASGTSRNRKDAQRVVETVLEARPTVSSWGAVTGPRGYRTVCRRDGMGGLTWQHQGGHRDRAERSRSRRGGSQAQGRLYRDAQNDYWDARARRARRRRGTGKTLGIVAGAVAALGVALVLAGMTGALPHKIASFVGSSSGSALEPEQQVEAAIDQAQGASVYSATATSITAMYQPADDSSSIGYMALCFDTQGETDNLTGVISEADLGGWRCVLLNEEAAIMGAAFSGGANWNSLSDVEPYLAADSVTREFADATGGTFIPA